MIGSIRNKNREPWCGAPCSFMVDEMLKKPGGELEGSLGTP